VEKPPFIWQDVAMAVTISSQVHDALVALAVAHPGVEVCGLLFGSANRIESFRQTANAAPDPTRFFEIDPAALIAAHREMRHGGLQLSGYFHSHPNGSPELSLADRAQIAGGSLLWAIVTSSGLSLWRVVNNDIHGVDLVLRD
jgi:desampylase